jgi:tetratricopeptide (TPR) repeat protein
MIDIFLSTGRSAAFALPLALCVFASGHHGEKTLIYDELRGIISVDEEELARLRQPKKNGDAAKTSPIPAPKAAAQPKGPLDDFHVDRKKDPPELYFESGLEYFRNRDYQNANKNFEFAYKRSGKPAYLLWAGKALRQLEHYAGMLKHMKEILRRFPESDVADDALFEIAFYYQKSYDYDSASIMYAILTEQYPFGLSYSNGEEFREVSRDQRRLMRAEMASTLRILGFDSDQPEENFRAFQKSLGLAVTGNADRKTVTRIRSVYHEKINAETQSEKMARRILKWKYVTGVIASALLINAAVMAFAFVRTGEQKARVVALSKTLSDLDVHSL